MSDVSDLNPKILEKIQEGAEAFRKEMREFCTEMREFRRETRDRFDHLEHRVDTLTLRVDRLTTDVKVQFDRVNSRIDGVIDMFGRYHADHEERIRRLEDRPST